MKNNFEQNKVERAACTLPRDLVSFLFRFLTFEDITPDEISTFTKQKSIPGAQVKEPEIESILELCFSGKLLHTLDTTALINKPQGIDFSFKKTKTKKLEIKQDPDEQTCKFDESMLNAFYKDIFPNIQETTDEAKSTLTIFLPYNDNQKSLTTWHLFNITDEIFDSEVSDNLAKFKRLRLAILLILLKQIKAKNLKSEEDKLTLELIDRLRLPIKKFGDLFFALDDDLTKQIVGEDYAKENTLLNFILKKKDTFNMDTFRVVTVSNTKTTGTATNKKAKDLAELNRAEQGACWGLGYFLAALDGIAIKIDLDKSDKYPIRNIIIAPKVMSDTLKQIQPYQSNYLIGQMQFDKTKDTYLLNRPYHLNKKAVIKKDPTFPSKGLTSITHSLLSGSHATELPPDEIELVETQTPDVKKRLLKNKDDEKNKLIYGPVYSPSFRNHITVEELKHTHTAKTKRKTEH